MSVPKPDVEVTEHLTSPVVLNPLENQQTVVSTPDSKVKSAPTPPVAEALDTKQIPKAELKSDADATLLSSPSENKHTPPASLANDATMVTPSNDPTMVAPSNDPTMLKPTGDNDQTMLAPNSSQSRVTEGFTRAPENKFSGSAGGAKCFGSYQIISELGRGGMGVVYKAHDPKLNREVAIKVLIAGEDASHEAIKRFHKEAEATAKLQHPNVVSIFDIGVQGNQHYFAMEFVKGRPLNEIIKSGELKTSDKLALMAKVAKAMDYCHQQGILHRDLKPANIFVTPNNEPKIMDFGLAKITESEDAHLTRTGTIMGTPSYMSPEQAESSKDIDARTDVWALGVILYEMLCGELPFRGNSSMEVLTKVAVEEPTPLIKKSKVSTDLNTVVMKCLEKSRDTRYQTAHEFAKDLEAFLNGEAISAKPPSSIQKILRKIKKNRTLAGVSAIFLLVLLIGAITGWHYYGKAQTKPQIMAHLDRLQPDEKNAQSAIDGLKPWIENSTGMEILVEELASHSDSHRWGALLAVQKVAPRQYCEQVMTALTRTTNPEVERVALEYLKEDLTKERLKRIIEKTGGIRNHIVADNIFVEYGKLAGVDGLQNIVVGKDWTQTTLDVHKKSLGGKGFYTLISQIKHSASDQELINSLRNVRTQQDWTSWYPNVSPLLISMLHEKRPVEVRIEITLCLNGKDPDTISALTELMKNETNAQLVTIAFASLSESPEGIVIIGKTFAEEKRPEMRLLFSKNMIVLLMNMKEGMVQTLKNTLPPELSDALITALRKDPSAQVRGHIAQALLYGFNNKTGTDTIVNEIIAAATSEKNSMARSQMVHALLRASENDSFADLTVPFFLNLIKSEKNYALLSQVTNLFPYFVERGKITAKDIPVMLETKNNLVESRNFFNNILGTFTDTIYKLSINDKQKVFEKMFAGIKNPDPETKSNTISIATFLANKGLVFPEITNELFNRATNNDKPDIHEIVYYMSALSTQNKLTIHHITTLGNILKGPNNTNELSGQIGYILINWIGYTDDKNLAIPTCLFLINHVPFGVDKKQLIDKFGKLTGQQFADIPAFEKWWEENKDKDFAKFPPDITNK